MPAVSLRRMLCIFCSMSVREARYVTRECTCKVYGGNTCEVCACANRKIAVFYIFVRFFSCFYILVPCLLYLRLLTRLIYARKACRKAAVPCAVGSTQRRSHGMPHANGRRSTKDTRPRTVSLQSHSLNAKRNRERTVHANVSESCACAWLLVPRGWVLRCVVVVVGWLARWEGGCAPSGVRLLRAPG